MLHAVKQGKSGIYKRYSGVRDGTERKVSEEDEITSAIFGPHDFLESHLVFHFWREIFRLQALPKVFATGVPKSHRLDLWPKRNRVEPDAFLQFEIPDEKPINLLIEFKWRAPLSGPDQLHKQWKLFLTAEERLQSWHVFIGPEISQGAAAKESDNVWRHKGEDRLILVSWAEVKQVADSLAGHSSSLGKWAASVSTFLEKIGIVRFEGFEHLKEMTPIGQPSFESFFRGWDHKFRGFQDVPEPPRMDFLLTNRFFTGSPYV